MDHPPLGRRSLIGLDCLAAALYTAVTLPADLGLVPCLVVAGVGLPVAVRRLWPLPVFCVVLAMSAVAMSLGVLRDPFVAAAFALYTVAVGRPSRRQVSTSAMGTLSAAGLLAVATIGLSVPETPSWWMNRLGLLPGGLVALGGALTVGRAVRDRRAFMARSAEQLAQRAVAREQLRIARELHDIVAHSMSVIAVKAGIANHVAEARPQEARDALAVIETTSRGALVELRHMLDVLRTAAGPAHADPAKPSGPGTPAQAGLAPAPGLAGLPGLVERAGMAGVRVDLKVDADELPEGVELSVYRIVQEALTNVVKHAAPARCAVTVTSDGREVGVEVTDDGPGTRTLPASPDGHGLIGMRERVTLYGGTFTAGPRPQGGFRVSVRLPYGEVS
ncbi:sensor histidine kinase [Sphaerisporangium sp. TRM90804]|uniref:sensor histidine kinase n=1 Tax=Sphaerisporangium sp. TRM90804 TaxID=3031113 RepID=UPI0024483CF5|nr:sensor histidine kinase [Sphaerisporangium sp. TRM90804]MDH2427017.1 sensor histidine kinase [Sphaerisporangium sp. TRM90804]